MVIWITGLAGAGKSTVARGVAQLLRDEGASVVLLDGDELREVFGGTHGYDATSREKLAARYARLCVLIAEQGPIVICATISLFHSVQRWNRTHIPGYIEVYLRVSPEICRQRGREMLYGDQTQLVVGQQIAAEEPELPDLVLDNGDGANVESLVSALHGFLKPKLVASA